MAAIREIDLNRKKENAKRKQEEFSWAIFRSTLICSLNMIIHIKAQFLGIPPQEFGSHKG